ncbi:hypothetical protein PRIPAC_91351, partial [Pristionchus pacificus]|uniref:Snurportin-1 n=1 Tax=Pristionchus pacificus TaxID=54126 RepID=A0A8R1UDK1_PRIPA
IFRMESELEGLAASLGGALKVDENSLGEHPRFSHQYKNAAKASEQQARRRNEALDRIRSAREDKFDRYRQIAEMEDEGESVSSEEARRLYDGALMTSEWLIDIPEELTQSWISVMIPTGKRALVIANRGVTKVYNKGGRLLRSLDSRLPGGQKGGQGKAKGHSCMLDCIVNLEKLQFFVLDVIQWNDMTFYESPFDLRRFYLNSRMEENMQLGHTHPKSRATFHLLPSCVATTEAIANMMSTSVDFPMDGVLFYHPEVLYTPGQSPLVGWLKPWMLPEILNVPIPEKFTCGAPSSALKFIEQFNEENNFSSQVKKNAMIE